MVTKNIPVHRLVLEAFVGPCPPGLECCHEDGNSANNATTNLRWDTHQSNVADMVRHGRLAKGEAVKHSKLSAEAVRQMRDEYAAGSASQEAISRRYGVTQATVSKIVRGARWRHIA